jgi:hypothetical protein
MAHVEIIPVRSRGDLKAFINLPWKIYQGDPHWIPPIKAHVAKLLDPRQHPFWTYSARELFLARKGDQVEGRIAAIQDGNSRLAAAPGSDFYAGAYEPLHFLRGRPPDPGV